MAPTRVAAALTLSPTVGGATARDEYLYSYLGIPISGTNRASSLSFVDFNCPTTIDQQAMADTQQPRRQQSEAKKAYLVLYNFVSAVAWLTVLGRTAAVLYLRNASFVYFAVGSWAKWTQTLAALEILHAALGKFRAPASEHWRAAFLCPRR